MSDTQNRSLSRGLDILERLSDEPGGLELHEIARVLAMPKSSAFNLVHTLVDKKYLVYNPDTARYSLSMRMFEIGASAVKGDSGETVVHRYMVEIFEGCQETIHCGVMDGTDVVYIDKVESSHSIRMTSRVGMRFPLFATAMGRSMLACLSDAQIRALYAHYDFKPLTQKARVRSIEDLLEEVARVRENGYALEQEESNDNVCCLSVAVRNRDGRPAYAVSISMPIFRAEPASIERYIPLLLRAQRRIERFLRVM